MTLNKAIKLIERILEIDDFDGDVRLTDEMVEALKFAIVHLRKVSRES